MLVAKDIGNGSLSLTGGQGMVATLSWVECMAAIEAPRVDRTKAHDLQDIRVLSVLAVLCGADDWEEGVADKIVHVSSRPNGLAPLVVTVRV